MRYVIAGRSETFCKYMQKHNYKDGVNIRYCVNKKVFSEIGEEDIIVLLHGWFARSWAKNFIKEIENLYPSITFEYFDGKIGEEERNKLKSETINSRFDMLDL